MTDKKFEYPAICLMYLPILDAEHTPILPIDIRTAAYHEAGHFIARVKKAIPVDGIELSEEDGMITGEVYIGEPAPPESAAGRENREDFFSTGRIKAVGAERRELENFAISCCITYAAGTQAELIFHDIDPLDGVLYDDTEDSQNIRHTLWRFYGRVPSGRVFYCQRFAYALLREYWHEVEAIAEALLERRSLTKEEGLQIIRESASFKEAC